MNIRQLALSCLIDFANFVRPFAPKLDAYITHNWIYAGVIFDCEICGKPLPEECFGMHPECEVAYHKYIQEKMDEVDPDEEVRFWGDIYGDPWYCPKCGGKNHPLNSDCIHCPFDEDKLVDCTELFDI